MAKDKGARLGKGLEAIFGESLNDVLEEIQHNEKYTNGKLEIDIEDIKPNPYQPRKKFDDNKIKELSESIKLHGVFTPIIVKKAVSGYELIAGERRLRASKLASLKKIPAVIVEFDEKDMMEVALLENVQRENLNAIEEAQGYKKLMNNLNYTQEEVAKRIGKSREYVANLLRLLNLPTKVQNYVIEGKLSMGHVRALLAIEDKSLIESIALKSIEEKLSVRNVENLVKNINEPKLVKKNKPVSSYANVEDIIQHKLQTKVTIDNNSIVIKFADDNDLNRILEAIDCLDD